MEPPGFCYMKKLHGSELFFDVECVDDCQPNETTNANNSDPNKVKPLK